MQTGEREALERAAEFYSLLHKQADSIEIGLLTCTPGREVYELYGHTAIRVHNLKSGEDLVYNYGTFDFRTPHFAWRFMMGQTDYTLSVVPFDRFVKAYAANGRGIDEQVINLLPHEAARILKVLEQQASAKNWTYRYNFLYDNCTTRAVRLILESLDVAKDLDRAIWWKEGWRGGTVRDIIHKHAADIAPWSSFGQDLILGEEVDARNISREQEMFAPLCAERYLDEAIIGTGYVEYPLVRVKRTLVVAAPLELEECPSSPLGAAILLLVVGIGISLWECWKRRLLYTFDDILLLLQGATGCIVALLFFCSEHPAVGSNWLILFLNPLPLVYLPYKIHRNRKGQDDHYVPILWVELGIVFLMFIISPQVFPREIYIVVLLLLVRGIALLRGQRQHRTAR